MNASNESPAPVRVRSEDHSPLLFDAVLRPNRSLNAGGFRVMMILVIIVAIVVSGIFALLGAWPVLGFFGIDILLLYWAFRVSYRSGLVYETLQLSADQLLVRRVRSDGKASDVWEFQPAWLQVLLEHPETTESRLVLASHGRSVVIGSFLTPQERVEVADALRAALVGCRAA